MIYFLTSIALFVLLWKIRPYLESRIANAQSRAEPKIASSTEGDKFLIEKESETSKCTSGPAEDDLISQEIIHDERVQTSHPTYEEEEEKEVWVGTVRVQETAFPCHEIDDGLAEEDDEDDDQVVGEKEEDRSSSGIASSSSERETDEDAEFLSGNVVTAEGVQEKALNFDYYFGVMHNVTTHTQTFRRTILNESVAMETHSGEGIQVKSTFSENTNTLDTKCFQTSEEDPTKSGISTFSTAVLDDAERCSFPQKKKPVGGVCLLGGEELLNKIKKRRIALDSAEAEQDIKNAPQKDKFDLDGGEHAEEDVAEDAKKGDVHVGEEEAARNVPYLEYTFNVEDVCQEDTKEHISHFSEDKYEQTDHREYLPHSWSSSPPQLPANSDPSENPSVFVGYSDPDSPDPATNVDTRSENALGFDWAPSREGHQMILLPTDGEVLTHLNKDRPKGPVKRKPSFNAGRT